MSAHILEGRTFAQTIEKNLKVEVTSLLERGLPAPRLDVILVGEDKASAIYVKHKQKACQNVGIQSVRHDLPSQTTQSDLFQLIESLNQNSQCDGILVQLPLPKHICTQTILECVDPDKDVDGFNPMNYGRLLLDHPGFIPCTPAGIMHLLAEHKVDLKGKQACVVGASPIVGKPMALLLIAAQATVTICQQSTLDLAKHVKEADILVIAVGKANLIPGDWIKPGAVVIDVGINRLENGTLCGDVQFDAASAHASAITPVPGGGWPDDRSFPFKKYT